MTAPWRERWWERRWRRRPFWAWAAAVLVGVGLIGALADADLGSGGSAPDDLNPSSVLTPDNSDSSATDVPPSITLAIDTASSVRTSSPPTTPTSPTTPTTSATSRASIPSTVAPSAAPTTTATGTSVVVVPPGWTVTSVVDGDTIHVAGPEGVLTVRLIGINTPEDDECWADEATAALSALIGGGQALTLVRDSSDTDQYGRALRYVETAGGVDVGAALVESGHAISRRYEPDTSRSDRYDALQGQASQAGLGQWAADACGLPVANVSIGVELRADATGDDNHNLNDEWVRFINTGTTAVDLDGWIVADESASHRFTFANLVLEPGRSVTLYSGCGGDTSDARYWCNTGSAVWNNSGDTVFLRDPSGNNVVVHKY